MKLFAYGTLLEPRVLEKVIGSRRAGVTATLSGFARYHFQNACYPGIIPERDGCVNGVVYSDIGPADWLRLDAFESDMYDRVAVSPVDENGMSLAAQTYVVSPEFRDHLSDHDWDFDYFRAVHLARYVDET